MKRNKNEVESQKDLELQVLLTEYTLLRDEAKNCDNVQMLVATICMAIVGALFSANIFFKTPKRKAALPYYIFFGA